MNTLINFCLIFFVVTETDLALKLLEFEKWKYQFDKNGFAGAMLMDLSKTFNTRNYLLIAKHNAYERSDLYRMITKLRSRTY